MHSKHNNYRGGIIYEAGQPGDSSMTGDIVRGDVSGATANDEYTDRQRAQTAAPVWLRMQPFSEVHDPAVRSGTTKKDLDMITQAVDRILKHFDAPITAAAKAAAVGDQHLPITTRVKVALDLAQNPIVQQTAAAFSQQQPSPALPAVVESLTQLANKQIQEELNKSTAINDPMEAQNASLRRQNESLDLQIQLIEKQEKLQAMQQRQQGAQQQQQQQQPQAQGQPGAGQQPAVDPNMMQGQPEQGGDQPMPVGGALQSLFGPR